MLINWNREGVRTIWGFDDTSSWLPSTAKDALQSSGLTSSGLLSFSLFG
ncbi:MAG: hypothetical protein VKO00_09385 [Cyanobacteriota bacterium]|nr:hypothetical protein [Cyanobacteriota bacterium]